MNFNFINKITYSFRFKKKKNLKNILVSKKYIFSALINCIIHSAFGLVQWLLLLFFLLKRFNGYFRWDKRRRMMMICLSLLTAKFSSLTSLSAMEAARFINQIQIPKNPNRRSSSRPARFIRASSSQVLLLPFAVSLFLSPSYLLVLGVSRSRKATEVRNRARTWWLISFPGTTTRSGACPSTSEALPSWPFSSIALFPVSLLLPMLAGK